MIEINEHKDTEVPDCNQLDGIIVYIRDNYPSIHLNEESRRIADHIAGRKLLCS